MNGHIYIWYEPLWDLDPQVANCCCSPLLMPLRLLGHDHLFRKLWHVHPAMSTQPYWVGCPRRQLCPWPSYAVPDWCRWLTGFCTLGLPCWPANLCRILKPPRTAQHTEEAVRNTWAEHINFWTKQSWQPELAFFFVLYTCPVVAWCLRSDQHHNHKITLRLGVKTAVVGVCLQLTSPGTAEVYHGSTRL